MKGALLALLIAAGCDIVYDLHRPPTDAPPEPGTDEARATFVRTVLDEPGGAVSTRPALDVTATVVLANGARPEVRRVGDDFVFAWTRGMTYELTFERPDRAPLTYLSDAEHLQHAQRELARDGAPPAAGSILDVTMTNLGTATFTYIMSTGTWAIGGSGSTLDQFAVDFTQRSTFLTGRPRLLTADDRLYCATFESVLDGAGGLAYNALKRVTSGTFAMLDGMRTPIACDVQDIPLDRCARIDIDRLAEAARVAGVAAPAFTGSSYSTQILAVPTPEFGPWSSLWLAFDNSSIAPTSSFNGTLHYANPFPGHGDAVFSWAARTRTVQVSGGQKAAVIAVSAGHFYRPAAACGAVAPVAEIAIPSPPAFGGAYVINDGELQLSSTRPVEVSWENRTPGPVDYYLVILSRLIETPDGGTGLEELRTWVTTGTELKLDRSLLMGSKQYVVSITATYGYPNVATGDFRTQRWPEAVAAATNYSGVFTVKP